MDANLDRAKVLTEALPYIQQYNGKIVVINCGGVPMTDPELREAVMSDIIMLRLVGIKVVLVHGIGPEAKEALKDAGMELQYKDGYPCVSDDALDVVQQVLCGKVNKGLVSALNQKGGKAIGLCGIDGGLLSAKTISPSYGRTGEVVKVDVTMVNSFLNQGYIPVIATVAQGADGLANVILSAPMWRLPSWQWLWVRRSSSSSLTRSLCCRIPMLPAPPCPSCICPRCPL